jgi:hypothetical protein
MRLTSDIWTSALIRRVFAEGFFGAVERRGAAEAGAIFIKARRRDGIIRLFGPAPQSFFEEGRPDERRFEERLATGDELQLQDSLERELKFDSDIWIIEIEVEQPEDYFAVVAAD